MVLSMAWAACTLPGLWHQCEWAPAKGWRGHVCRRMQGRGFVSSKVPAGPCRSSVGGGLLLPEKTPVEAGLVGIDKQSMWGWCTLTIS